MAPERIETRTIRIRRISRIKELPEGLVRECHEYTNSDAYLKVRVVAELMIETRMIRDQMDIAD